MDLILIASNKCLRKTISQVVVSHSFDDNLFLGDEIVLDDVSGNGLVGHIYDVRLADSPACRMMLLVKLEPRISMVSVSKIAQIVYLHDASAFAVSIFPHDIRFTLQR